MIRLLFFVLLLESVSIFGKPVVTYLSQDPNLLLPRRIEYQSIQKEGIPARLKKLGIKGNPKIKKTKDKRSVTFKFRSFQVTIIESYYGEKEISKITETYFYPFSKKTKEFSYFFNEPLDTYLEENNCYAYSSATAHVTDDYVGYGYWRCGRIIQDDSSYNNIHYQCWDVTSAMEERCEVNHSIDYSDPNKIIVAMNTEFTSSCKSKCFDIVPYLDTGRYIVRRSNVILREKPSRKKKQVQILQEGTSLVLIEDTGIIEEIEENIAPWVKVRLEDGVEGYVFGALIRKEGEFWP